VEAGVAVSTNGELLSIDDETPAILTTPIGNPSRSFIVVRQVITNTDPMTRPTEPGDTVYLHKNYSAEIVVAARGRRRRIPTTPTPTSRTNDVILCGVRLPAGATVAADDDNFDFSVRSVVGGGGYFVPQDYFFDPRMYSYADGTAQIRILPSQTMGAAPGKLAYGGGPKPLAFPLTSGVFVQTPASLNFTTGAIGGGDQDSPDFTPTIPTAGKFIWAVVTVGTDSLLSVAYGTEGTYAQCKAAMRSQTTAGAGAVPIATGAKIGFYLLGSTNGTTITEGPEIVDARGPGNVAIAGGAVSITALTSANSPYTMDGTEQHITIDASGGDVIVNLPARAANQGTVYPVDRIDASANNASLVAAGADTYAAPTPIAGTYPLSEYESVDVFAATTKWKIR
jgi:hypothetical protein